MLTGCGDWEEGVTVISTSSSSGVKSAWECGVSPASPGGLSGPQEMDQNRTEIQGPATPEPDSNLAPRIEARKGQERW